METNFTNYIRGRIFDNSKVVRGTPAARYSPAYAEWKRKHYGYSKVNLANTGELLNSIFVKYKPFATTVASGEGYVTPLGVFEVFARGVRKSGLSNAVLAAYLNDGTSKMPTRPFLDLSSDEINEIMRASMAGKTITANVPTKPEYVPLSE